MNIVKLALASLAALSVPASAQPSDGLTLVDYTDEFAQVWDATAALPDAERTAKFKADFAKILPGFYDHQRMRGGTEAKYDEYLLKGLKAYPEQRAGIARVSKEFAQSIAPAQASFEHCRVSDRSAAPPLIHPDPPKIAIVRGPPRKNASHASEPARPRTREFSIFV